MKVNHVTERSETQQGTSLLDSDEMERAGIDLGTLKGDDIDQIFVRAASSE